MLSLQLTSNFLKSCVKHNKLIRYKSNVASVNDNSVRTTSTNQQILGANYDDIIAVVVDTREFRRNGESGKNGTCFCPHALFSTSFEPPGYSAFLVLKRHSY